MSAVGFAFIAIGIIAVIYGIMQRMKAGRVTDAPFASTGDVAGRGPQVASPKGAVSAQGNVMCQQPIYSPVTGVPCLFYELKVSMEWKDGDTTKTKEIDHQKVAAQFAINDGSGPVWVDLREGGDFEPIQKKEMEQSTGLLKGIVGGELMFGNYRLNAGIGSLGTTYKVEEKVLPMQPFLYACGKLADGGGVITAPSWRSLIVSNQNRDALLASATKTAKIGMIGGGVGLVAGIALAVIGGMTSSDAQPEAAGSATPTAVAAAPTDAPSAEPTDAPAATGTPTSKKAGSTVPAKATTTTAASTVPATTAAATAAAATTAAATTTAAPKASATATTRPAATSAVKPLIKPKK